MRKILIIFMICMAMLTQTAYGVSMENVMAAQEGVSENAAENIAMINGDFSLYDVAKSVGEGKYDADLGGVLRKITDIFFMEVKANIKIMGAVMLLGVFYSFISGISSSFGQNGVSEAAFLCCYAVFAGIVATGFYEITECAKNAISDMGLFMKSLIPTLASLSAAEGRVITASALNAEVLTATAVCSYVTEKVVLPLLYASFALKFINNMTADLSLGSLGRMADKLCRRILGFMLLIFTAMLTLSGFAAGTAENMGLKTARFALSSFIPVTGGALADSVSSIVASATMIKNSAGIAGIVAIVFMVAYPVIKCAAVSFIYNFMGALLEPVCDSRLSKAVSSVGESMGVVFSVVAVTAAQCIISAAVFLSSYRG